jgi:Protein of unknown function (DUF3301)
MLSLTDLFMLLALGGIVASWFVLTAARERAIYEAQRLCRESNIQLLDESVALKGLRLHRDEGHLGFERRYGFELSTDGKSRQMGQLWMRGRRVVNVILPDTAEDEIAVAHEPEFPESAYIPRRPPVTPKRVGEPSGSNVIPFRPRPPRNDA